MRRLIGSSSLSCSRVRGGGRRSRPRGSSRSSVRHGSGPGLVHGTCHELRHTCFTRLREGGMAIEAVQAQAGHRSIVSTRIYLHLSIDWLAEEYAKGMEAIRDIDGGGPMRPPQRQLRSRRRGGARWSSPGLKTARRAPVMVATMASYLDQLGVSARPTTVGATEQMLRHFAGQVTEADPTCASMAAVERRHIEAHKLWLAARPGKAGKGTCRRHHPESPRNVAHLLRAAARLGLRRCAKPDLDFSRRLPPGGRAAAKVPRRPDHGEVQGRTGQRSQPTPAPHGRDPGPDRHPGRRARRAPGRCSDHARRFHLTAHPGGQVAQRPLRAVDASVGPS